jgi:hypothetical protein
MREAITDIKESIGDVVFAKKIRYLKVISLLYTYEYLRLLQEDPVHLAAEGCSTLVHAFTFCKRCPILIRAIPL